MTSRKWSLTFSPAQRWGEGLKQQCCAPEDEDKADNQKDRAFGMKGITGIVGSGGVSYPLSSSQSYLCFSISSTKQVSNIKDITDLEVLLLWSEMQLANMEGDVYIRRQNHDLLQILLFPTHFSFRIQVFKRNVQCCGHLIF